MAFRYPNTGSVSLSRSNSLRTLELGGLSSQPRARAPISPPETERSAPTLATLDRHTVDHRAPTLVDGVEGDSPEDATPYVRHTRRAPSIHYHQANLNPRQHAQRTPRWLVVVMPPSSLNNEPALGHTLAMGPPGRFQSGILMPLFPTMYAQLAAIAKEFNLPSTSGVCIYLHISKPDLNISPRISDDTWQLLWSPYFNGEDGMTPDMSGLPICGKIEFDVDIRKARWYDSWLNRQERQIALDASIPASIAHTMSRWYNEHRETTVDESDAVAAAADNVSISVLHTQARTKPIPRPLTLSAQAHGEGSNRSVHKYKAINTHDGDLHGTATTESIASGPKRMRRRLSPVVQMDESATAKQDDLDTLVRNWRAATPMAPVIPRNELGPQGESLQDPDTLDSRCLSEIDMNEFQWSVSSPGPESPLQFSPQYAAPLPSVHLEGRMAGSVILTPSVATSFGPNDSYYSPMPTSVAFPSPDIAFRMLEDSPPTPTTATSFGPPLSYPSTPASIQRIPTPDLAARQFFSRPATPSTATTWGAPSTWPATPASLFYRASTPDLGQRGLESAPTTPSTATTFGPPDFWPPSPVEEFRVATPDVSSRILEDEAEQGLVRYQPFEFVWPFLLDLECADEPTTTPPSRNISVEQDDISTSARREESPFPFVWPFFNTSCSTAIGLTEENPHSNRNRHPYIVVYPDVVKSTHHSVDAGKQLELDAPQTYGYFNLYPAVYPAVVPYPPLYEVNCMSKEVPQTVEEPSRELESTRLTPPYPFFDLYPAGYPSLVIYPIIRELPVSKKECSPEPINLRLPWNYPNIEIYPSGYPHLEIYPAVKAKDVQKPKEAVQEPLSMSLPSSYPHLNIYPAVYPHLEIYPPVAAVPSKEIEKRASKPTTSIIERRAINTRLPRHYPLLEIYPPGYPHIEIYPPVPSSLPVTGITPSFWYPNICIYEPLKSSMPFGLPRAFVSDVSVTLETKYPFFNIYPAVYPHLEIYPPVAATMEERKPVLEPVLLPGSICDYPHIGIYPPVQATKGHNPKQLSISILNNSRATARVQSPRTRTRRGSNQWGPTANAPIAPRHRRGSTNIFDALECAATQAPARTVVVKPATRPQIKPRKSHQDLHHEVFAQLAPYATDIFAMKSLNGTGLRRIVSARVDGVPPTVLARSRTVTMAPPVPSLPDGIHDAEAIDLTEDVWGAAAMASRVSQSSTQQVTVEGTVFKLERSVSKLDKSRYTFV